MIQPKALYNPDEYELKVILSSPMRNIPIVYVVETFLFQSCWWSDSPMLTALHSGGLVTVLPDF